MIAANNVANTLGTAKSDSDIAALLDNGDTYNFTFQGDDYTLKKAGSNYKAFNDKGQVIDSQVQMHNNLTVQGFIV